MEMRIDFLSWLSKKLYLINLALYATIGLVMTLPAVFAKYLEISPILASFGAYFVVLFLRAAYESIVVYEAPIKSLSPHKMLILTLVTASIISLISVFLKPKIGYFSIPVALIISMTIVGKLKAALWPATQRTGFLAELPAKLELVSLGRYGFYAIFVGIAYIACAKYGVDFIYAFPAGFFIGMIFEETYNLTKLYEQKLTAKSAAAMIIWSAVCAIGSTAIIIAMIKQFGFQDKVATIAGVIIIKLIQPLGSRKFILGL